MKIDFYCCCGNSLNIIEWEGSNDFLDALLEKFSLNHSRCRDYLKFQNFVTYEGEKINGN